MVSSCSTWLVVQDKLVKLVVAASALRHNQRDAMLGKPCTTSLNAAFCTFCVPEAQRRREIVREQQQWVLDQV